jgi:hypothetical protein
MLGPPAARAPFTAGSKLLREARAKLRERARSRDLR